MSSADKTTNAVHGEQDEGTGLGNRPNEPAMSGWPKVGGARVAAQVSLWQLNLLRVGYLVMGGGPRGGQVATALHSRAPGS